MADSHHYHSQTFTNNQPDLLYDILKAAGSFLHNTVGNGWEELDHTGKDEVNPGFAKEIMDNYTIDWDPLGASYNDGAGGGTVDGPEGINSSFARTVYLRWSDGNGSEHNKNRYDYFLTTIDIYNNANSYSDIRIGTLLEPWTEVLYWGSFPYVPTYDSIAGWSGEPSDPAVGFYGDFPVEGSHTAPTAPLNQPAWGFNSQPGYRAGAEVITNFCNWGDNPNVIGHFFGGVENGAPYIYICIESSLLHTDGVTTEKYFCQFGVGNVIKSGTWKGGQFSCGSCLYNHPSYYPSVTSNYNCRMFDSNDTRYAGSRSLLYFSQNDEPYDSNVPETLPEKYLFGYSYGNYQYRCYGDALGGINYQPMLDSKNTFNGRTTLFPMTVRVHDLTADGQYLMAGFTPAMRMLQIDTINPGTEIVENGTTWKIFPVRAKLHAGSVPRSGMYGYAFRMD